MSSTSVPKLPRVEQVASIPRVLHQTFPSRILPIAFRENVRRLRELHPNWDYRFYDDDDIVQYIRAHYGEEIFAYFMRIDPRYGAARADVFRYLLMYREGGVYLDIKSAARGPLDEVLRSDDQYVLSYWRGSQFSGWGDYPELREYGGREFQQWHIITAPGHPYLRSVLEIVLQNIESYAPLTWGVGRKGVMRVTGPVAYTRAIGLVRSKYPHRLVNGQDELLLEYTTLSDGYHRSLFKFHYTFLREPVVLLEGRRRITWILLGPVYKYGVIPAWRIVAAILRRINKVILFLGGKPIRLSE
jgi:inositol phosphorylceramide mannosyltransferase catalytic subunit